MNGLFNRLRETQDDILSRGGNFVAFEYWGGWTARLGGVFDFAELRHISNVLKSPTSKKISMRYKVEHPEWKYRVKQKGLFDE